MPMYEYRCAECGHEFEVIQRFSDEPLTRCPRCSGPVTKLVSQGGFQLKGSGWYVTDYARKKDAGGKAAEAGKTDVKPDAKAESTAESKTAASSATAPEPAKKSS